MNDLNNIRLDRHVAESESGLNVPIFCSSIGSRGHQAFRLRLVAHIHMLGWQWCLFAAWLVALSPASGQESLDDEMPDDQDIAEEAMSPEQLRALHAKFDQNGDGKVSLSEVLDFGRHMSKAIAGKDVTAILAEIDTDKDGNLPEL